MHPLDDGRKPPHASPNFASPAPVVGYRSTLAVKASGWRLWVNGEPGTGATFSFTLPT